MKIDDIKINGIYKTCLNVEFREIRGKKEIRPVEFLIKVIDKNSITNTIEITFLNSGNNYTYHLDSSQIFDILA